MPDKDKIEPKVYGTDAYMKSIIDGYHTEFSTTFIDKKEDTSPEWWARMGGPFYRVHMFEGYTNQSVDGYLSQEEFERFVKRMARID